MNECLKCGFKSIYCDTFPWCLDCLGEWFAKKDAERKMQQGLVA